MFGRVDNIKKWSKKSISQGVHMQFHPSKGIYLLPLESWLGCDSPIEFNKNHSGIYRPRAHILRGALTSVF